MQGQPGRDTRTVLAHINQLNRDKVTQTIQPQTVIIRITTSIVIDETTAIRKDKNYE